MRRLKIHFIFLICTIFLFQFSDALAQWEKSNGGLSFKSVWSIAAAGTTIFAGTSSNGVYVSTDSGENFEEANNGITNNFIPAMIISGTNVLAGTYGDGIFKSTDNGANWTDANSNGSDTTAIFAFVNSGNNIFAGTDVDGIYLSTDNGNGWFVVNNGLSNMKIRALSVYGTSVIAGTFGGGIFTSTDNGTAWNESNSGFPGSVYINCLAVSGLNIFAGTGVGTSDNIMYRSTDNGGSWKEASNGLANNTKISALAVRGSNIFAATSGDGVFSSTDNGESWNPINDGLTSKFTFSLAISESYLLLGTTGGVWRRALPEITDVKLNSNTIPTVFKLEQNYPNPFNPTTKIKYTIPSSINSAIEGALIQLKIYDILGNVINTLVNEVKSPGVYEAEFDASSFSSGVYFYQLRVNEYFDTKKMILIR